MTHPSQLDFQDHRFEVAGYSAVQDVKVPDPIPQAKVL